MMSGFLNFDTTKAIEGVNFLTPFFVDNETFFDYPRIDKGI